MDMSCIQDHYGRSIVELLIPTTSFKKMQRAGKYPRLQLELIPVFHSSIPFHYSIPLIPDSRLNKEGWGGNHPFWLEPCTVFTGLEWTTELYLLIPFFGFPELLPAFYSTFTCTQL